MTPALSERIGERSLLMTGQRLERSVHLMVVDADGSWIIVARHIEAHGGGGVIDGERRL